jgi:hypothetical protein
MPSSIIKAEDSWLRLSYARNARKYGKNGWVVWVGNWQNDSLGDREFKLNIPQNSGIRRAKRLFNAKKSKTKFYLHHGLNLTDFLEAVL